jgi:predicted enzyme related to lactoylglutathione lyase
MVRVKTVTERVAPQHRPTPAHAKPPPDEEHQHRHRQRQTACPSSNPAVPVAPWQGHTVVTDPQAPESPKDGDSVIVFAGVQVPWPIFGQHRRHGTTSKLNEGQITATRVESMYFLPVSDLQAAVGFYRHTLGWPEVWSEGHTTVSVKMPGELQIMLNQSAGPPRPGPIAVVDDVRAWCAEHRETIHFWLEPEPIPGGYWAGFDDPFGNAMYVVDQSLPDT